VQAVDETCARCGGDAHALACDGHGAVVGHADVGALAPDVMPPGRMIVVVMPIAF